MTTTFTTKSNRNYFELLAMNLFLFLLLVLISSLALNGLKYFFGPFNSQVLVTIGSILATITLVIALKKIDYMKKQRLFLIAASFFYTGCILAFCLIVF